MHWLRWLFLTSPHSIPARDAPAPWTWWDDDANLNISLTGTKETRTHLVAFEALLTCLLNT